MSAASLRRDTSDTKATFAGNKRGLLLLPWTPRRAPRPAIGEAQMLKLIVAATLVVLITSSSAIAGIVLAHAALARTSTMNAGAVADEAQSFRLVAKAPLTFDW
jgi:hypothetical protein